MYLAVRFSRPLHLQSRKTETPLYPSRLKIDQTPIGREHLVPSAAEHLNGSEFEAAHPSPLAQLQMTQVIDVHSVYTRMTRKIAAGF